MIKVQKVLICMNVTEIAFLIQNILTSSKLIKTYIEKHDQEKSAQCISKFAFALELFIWSVFFIFLLIPGEKRF